MTTDSDRISARPAEAGALAPCSVCGRAMRVKKDGTVRHHGGALGGGWMGNRSYRCDGTDKPPATGEPS